MSPLLQQSASQHPSVVTPGVGSGRRTGQHQLPGHEEIRPRAEACLSLLATAVRTQTCARHGCHLELTLFEGTNTKSKQLLFEGICVYKYIARYCRATAHVN